MNNDPFEERKNIFVSELKKPEKDEYGFQVIFLPPYSLDLNPIEKF